LDYGDDLSVSSEINSVVEHRQDAKSPRQGWSDSAGSCDQLMLYPAAGCITRSAIAGGWSWACSEY